MTEAERLTELLKGKPEDSVSAYDIASKAHHWSSRKQHRDAALLFEAAGRRAQAELDDGSYDERNETGVRINQALNHWARAGFQWVKANEMARALPLLRHVVESDWLAAGLNHDLNTVAAAWTHLVQHAAQEGRDAFEQAHARATVACAALEVDFPSGLPHQMALAETAVDLGCSDIAAAILEPLRTRKPMPRSLKAFLREMDTRLERCPG